MLPAGCAIGLLTQDTTLTGNDCLLVGNNLGLIFLNGFLVGQHGRQPRRPAPRVAWFDMIVVWSA